MRVSAHGGTDTGQTRDHNEDFFLTLPSLGLHVVCDGMGGHAAGEVASAMAARTFAAQIEQNREVFVQYDDSSKAREHAIETVRSAIEEASRKVYEHACSDRGRAGMGTTLIAMMVVGNKGIMGHVGDSRLYMLRNGKLDQLSVDHSYTTELIKHGMSPEQARRSAFANRLTRAIGVQPEVEVDTLLFDILPGDTFLLCSDGLSGYFEGTKGMEELAGLLKFESQQDVPQQLLNIANARGGKDNITAIVVSPEPDQKNPQEDERRITEVNLQITTLRHISLFQNLTLRETVGVLSKMRTLHHKAGETIIRENEHDDRLFILLKGKLQVSRNNKEVAVLNNGCHFGEMALVRTSPRSATVKTIEPSRFLVMERRDFELILRKAPSLGVKLLSIIAQVLSERLDNALSKAKIYG